MPVTINGTTGIAGVDGSASTPAVQGTDTNTGIFFPAADTIAFAEGGTEVMRIDSSGNVGIGKTPSTTLDVNGTASATTFSGSGASLTSLNASNISSGTLATARLGTGTANSSTFLRGDQTWAAVSGGVTSVASGNGMNFTTITSTGTVTLGTPSDISNTTSNSVTSTSHTHALSGELVETTTGSPLYYGARSWVNFNGTGTVSIRASSNVSSITDNGTGNYNVNFSTSMPNANYATYITSAATDTTGSFSTHIAWNGTYSTSAVQVYSFRDNVGAIDTDIMCVLVFR